MKQLKVSVNPDFENWAKSYTGCDGGNLNGAIWLCGIEWGGGDNPAELDFKEEIKNLKTEVPQRTDEDTEKILKNSSRKYTYDQNAFKLLTTITTNKRLSEVDYKQYASEHITYTKNSQFFKMNLYPISFKDTDEKHWHAGWANKTGFPTKYHYLLWCWKHRFELIKKWVKEGKPKLIICVGKTLFTDYVLAFEGIEDVKWHDNLFIEQVGDRELSWLKINGGNTVLAVTPFLTNRFGLNSDKRIEDMGLRIREICDTEFGSKWFPKSS